MVCGYEAELESLNISSSYFEEIVKITWNMLTKHNTPMILCQPEKFSNQINTIHHQYWGSMQPGDKYKLDYYQPVLLYEVGGPVALKGIVGRVHSDNGINTADDSSSDDSDSGSDGNDS